MTSSVWIENLKTSLMKHEHVRVEKVGPGAVAQHPLKYPISFKGPKAQDPMGNKGRSRWSNNKLNHVKLT